MTITLTPEQEAFIAEELRAGRFRTAEEAVTSALELLRFETCTPEDLAAIREGLDQVNRGEGIPIEQFKANIARKYGL